MLRRDGFRAVCVYLKKLLLYITEGRSADGKPAPSSLWSHFTELNPQHLCFHAFGNYFYEKRGSLCFKSCTWEEHISVRCLAPSVLLLHFFFNFIVCTLIQQRWAGGDDTCSPHFSLFMVKSGLSWGSTLAGRSIPAFEHAAGFNLKNLGGEWWGGGDLSLQEPHFSSYCS